MRLKGRSQTNDKYFSAPGLTSAECSKKIVNAKEMIITQVSTFYSLPLHLNQVDTSKGRIAQEKNI